MFGQVFGQVVFWRCTIMGFLRPKIKRTSGKLLKHFVAILHAVPRRADRGRSEKSRAFNSFPRSAGNAVRDAPRPPGSLRRTDDAERRKWRSHAERGNEKRRSGGGV